VSEQKGHIIPYRTLTAVWITLVVLTAVTVAASRVEAGAWNVVIALGIASVKAGLVVFFFMHMKYEPHLLRWLFYLTLVILAIFIGLTFFDVLYR
jgi:cytochrome c oxidase subunit IV